MATAFALAFAKHAAPEYSQEKAGKPREEIEIVVVPGFRPHQAGFSFSDLSRVPGADRQ